MNLPFPILSADEAAALINNGQTIGFSGFTPAGAAKAVPRAIARRAEAEHAAGRPFKIGVVTGASTGASLDGALARADAIAWRTPYQSDKDLRDRINKGQTKFFDMHLSMLPQYVRYGFLGKFHHAVVEACNVTADGEITLTTSIGATPTFLRVADKIIIELNSYHPKALKGFHDIFEQDLLPFRREIPIYAADDRIGSPVVKVDPSKIAGIVLTNEPDEARPFTDPDAITMKIGRNVADFISAEIKANRIPKEFLPIQSGVGNIANALLIALGEHPGIPAFKMYSEVIQDSVVDLMDKGRITFASGTSMSLSKDYLDKVYGNLDGYRSKMVLRPQAVSNHPEIVRRLGIISINTALEVDIFGNVNSTHVLGKDLMNGIGGSGDFTRNAFISIFTCPSVAKRGAISAIVPLCSHLDHSEHSVQVIATEHGVADLRGKDPYDRARAIIDNCAHPDYRVDLHKYLGTVAAGHTPQTLSSAFAMHTQFMKTGSMKGVNWEAFDAEAPAASAD
ncbi:MAG: succinate CoA transferase [Verrucomicrobiota bacterium]|nr:succinate CoA transferase [Verrucomicrobiota bacterium]